MRKSLTAFFLLLGIACMSAQSSQDRYATFPGGMERWTEMYSNLLVYPPRQTDGVLTYQMIIAPTGELKDVRVLETSGDPILDEAVLRAVRRMPKWKPAKDMANGEYLVLKRMQVFKLSTFQDLGETHNTVRRLTYVPLDENNEPVAISVVPDQLPRPPQGINGFLKLLNSHAQYPTSAMLAREEGAGIVQFDVSKNGKLSNISVVESSGIEALDRAAAQLMKYVSRWQPAPDKENGVNIRCYALFVYSLSDVVESE